MFAPRTHESGPGRAGLARPGTTARLRVALGAAISLCAVAVPARAWSSPTPVLPDPPPGSSCVLIQRGVLGEAWDADVSIGNGTWATGAYPYTWTGPSPYDHWSLHRFDLSPVPAGAQIVLAAFTVYVSWNDQSAEVRLHRILAPWAELTVTWQSFGGTASWDPAIAGAFNGAGVGHKTVDVTELVQGWQAGLYPNHGLLMEEDPVKLHAYFAGETGTVQMRPSLHVCYVAGGPCAGAADGAPCDDGNLCTTGDACLAGQCAGGPPVTCAAVDDRHEPGVCDPATGACTTTEKLDGAPCSDGDLCTADDVCLAGMCVGTSPVSCFDGSACTIDVCDPVVGCVNSAVSCDDGNACTWDGCDPAGGCTHTAIVCDDGDVCTADVCDPASGCGIAPLSCDDGDACTVDGCDSQLGCSHSPLSCDDGDACTADTCDAQVGCEHYVSSCDDGVSCTADSCATGACEHVVACPQGGPCAPGFCASAPAQTAAYAWLCE